MIRFAVWLESLGNKLYIGVLIFFAAFCSFFGYLFAREIPIWRAVLAMALGYTIVILICVYAMVVTSSNRTA